MDFTAITDSVVPGWSRGSLGQSCGGDLPWSADGDRRGGDICRARGGTAPQRGSGRSGQKRTCTAYNNSYRDWDD